MRIAGALMWLLAAVRLSRELTVQTAADASSTTLTTASSELAVTSEFLTTTTAVSVDQVGDRRFCNETISDTFMTDCEPCSLNAWLGCPDGRVQLTQVLSHSHYDSL